MLSLTADFCHLATWVGVIQIASFDNLCQRKTGPTQIVAHVWICNVIKNLSRLKSATRSPNNASTTCMIDTSLFASDDTACWASTTSARSQLLTTRTYLRACQWLHCMLIYSTLWWLGVCMACTCATNVYSRWVERNKFAPQTWCAEIYAERHADGVNRYFARNSASTRLTRSSSSRREAVQMHAN